MSPRSPDPRERGNPACEKMQQRQKLSVSSDKIPFCSEFQGLLGRNCSGVTIPIKFWVASFGKKRLTGMLLIFSTLRDTLQGVKFTACWQTLPASSLYQSLKSRLQAVPFWLVERVRSERDWPFPFSPQAPLRSLAPVFSRSDISRDLSNNQKGTACSLLKSDEECHDLSRPASCCDHVLLQMRAAL